MEDSVATIFHLKRFGEIWKDKERFGKERFGEIRKDLESGYAGFSTRQSQCKMSEVEIQAKRFMVSTLHPNPKYHMLKRLSQQNLK